MIFNASPFFTPVQYNADNLKAMFPQIFPNSARAPLFSLIRKNWSIVVYSHSLLDSLSVEGVRVRREEFGQLGCWLAVARRATLNAVQVSDGNRTAVVKKKKEKWKFGSVSPYPLSHRVNSLYAAPISSWSERTIAIRRARYEWTND